MPQPTKTDAVRLGELTHTVIEYLQAYDQLETAGKTHVHYQANARILLAPLKTIARTESAVRDAGYAHEQALTALRAAVHMEKE